MPRLDILAPFGLPIVFGIIYEPINKYLTVRVLGCGCPPIHGTRLFNANDFNLILWALVAGLCIWLWQRRVATFQPGGKKDVRRLTIVLGCGTILLECVVFLSRGWWM